MRYIEFIMDCPGEEMDARCEKMAELGAGGFVIENEDDFKDFPANKIILQYYKSIKEDFHVRQTA